jgi:hypothetical protein
VPVFDDQGLSNETAGEIGRNVANAEHLGHQTLMVRHVAHRVEAHAELISQHRLIGRCRPNGTLSPFGAMVPRWRYNGPR